MRLVYSCYPQFRIVEKAPAGQAGTVAPVTGVCNNEADVR